MLDVIFRNFISACVFWRNSCNLHCYVFSHLFDLVVHYVCSNFYYNTDLPPPWM